MAVSMVPPFAPSASQWASAASHLDRREDWRFVRIAGTRYAAITSGTSGKTYLARADAAGCSCPWYTRTARQCSHMLALELAATEDDLRAAATERPAPVADAESDAAFLERLQAEHAKHRRQLLCTGWAADELMQDATYAERVHLIGRLQARVAGPAAMFALNPLAE